MSKHKRLFRNYTTIDYHVLEEDLARLANKGYILESHNFLGFYTFKQTDLTNIKYNIFVNHPNGPFTKINKYDDSTNKQLCLEKGWQFICSNNNFQIYYSSDEEIHEPMNFRGDSEYAYMLPAVKRILLSLGFSTLLWLGLFIYFVINMSASNLASSGALLALSVFLLFALYNIYFSSHFFTWLIKNRKNKNGKTPLYYPGKGQLFSREFFTYLAIFITFAGIFRATYLSDLGIPTTAFELLINIIAYGLLFYGIHKLIPHFKEQSSKIIGVLAIIIVFSIALTFLKEIILPSPLTSYSDTEKQTVLNLEPPALRVNDFNPDALAHVTDAKHTSSFLIDDYINVIESSETDRTYIFNVYYDCNYDWVADYVMEKNKDNRDVIPMDLDFWGVDEGYYYYSSKELACFRVDNKIYIFNIGKYGNLEDYESLIKEKIFG